MEKKVDDQLDRRLAELRHQKREKIAHLEQSLSVNPNRVPLYAWVFLVLHFISMLESYSRGNGFKFVYNWVMVLWFQRGVYVGVAVPVGLFVMSVTFFW